MAGFSEWILANEGSVRLWFFLVGFSSFFILGLVAPFRAVSKKKMLARWFNNSILTFFNSFLLKLLMPFTIIFLAQKFSTFGLLSYLGGSLLVKIILGAIILDFIIYWQHRMFHVVPFFWRLHRVHHTDTEFDVTTALRFHTIEIIISYFIKAAIVITIAVPVEAVIIFEVILNFCAMFNHGNYKLPSFLEKYVRLIIVTPSMHRVHHSVIVNETNSNYGFCLSLWDRLFGSYIDEPKNSPQTMPIGIESYRAASENNLINLLTQPFRAEKKSS